MELEYPLVLFVELGLRHVLDVVELDCVSFVPDYVLLGIRSNKVLKFIDLLVVLDVRGEIWEYLRDLEFLFLQVAELLLQLLLRDVIRHHLFAGKLVI